MEEKEDNGRTGGKSIMGKEGECNFCRCVEK